MSFKYDFSNASRPPRMGSRAPPGFRFGFEQFFGPLCVEIIVLLYFQIFFNLLKVLRVFEDDSVIFTLSKKSEVCYCVSKKYMVKKQL